MGMGEKVTLFLQRLDFPASKEQCIAYAREHNAPQDVLDALAKLPDDHYPNITTVWTHIEENL